MKDLADLPATDWPGFTLPLAWDTKEHFQYHLYRATPHSFLVLLLHEHAGHHTIVSGLEFRELKPNEYLEQDCYLRDQPSCEGRLCGGLIVGLIQQSRQQPDAGGTFRPLEAWKVTSAAKSFVKIPASTVVCRPQSYAN